MLSAANVASGGSCQAESRSGPQRSGKLNFFLRNNPRFFTFSNIKLSEPTDAFIRLHTTPSGATKGFTQLYSHMQYFSQGPVNRLALDRFLEYYAEWKL